MRRIGLVARHEYLTNLKRRSFLFAAFGIPVFVIFVMLIVFAVVSNEGDPTSLGKVGYVDQVGVLANAVNQPPFFVPYEQEDAARIALENGDLGAYFVLPPGYMLSGAVKLTSSASTPESLETTINDFLLANLMAQVNTNIPADRLREPVNMRVYIEDSGRELTLSALPGLFLMPIVFVMVFIMASQITSGFLMSSVVEEKTGRIMEILITSVTPMQLLMGKIIGLGGLGLTQMVAWMGVGALLLTFGQGKSMPFLPELTLPLDLVLISLLYFLLSYFLMASIMAGIGAIVGSEQESRQFAGLISLIWVIPFILIVTFVDDPNGTVPVVLTLIPFTAPISVIMRMSFGTVPPVELVASVAILIATAILVTWGSAKVFRWGLLLYGKRPTPREIWRVIRQSPQLATTDTQPTRKVIL